jgi:hypothetical protein
VRPRPETASGRARAASLCLAAALLLLGPAGCAADEPRGGGARGGVGGGTAARADPDVERLLSRLRDYVYATYEVDLRRDEPALDRLRRAREALSAAMTDAGLATREQGLAGVVGALRDLFLARSDLVFVPLDAEAAGIQLVRVEERRAVAERDLAGRRIGYKLVAFEEVAIEDVAGWRARVEPSGGPLRPVVRASGRTLFVDRRAALRLARDVVLPRAAAARALEARSAAGEALSAAETKDLLRHRALATSVAQGEASVARAIEAEEELRTAAWLSQAPPAPAALDDEGVAVETERRAILAAAVAGEPRYHLASALSATIAAPGSPPARGAEAALASFAARPLHAWTPEELRAAARRALGAAR